MATDRPVILLLTSKSIQEVNFDPKQLTSKTEIIELNIHGSVPYPMCCFYRVNISYFVHVHNSYIYIMDKYNLQMEEQSK